jgi:hypothetical protein
MPAGGQDLVLFRGNSCVIQIQVQADKNGEPISLADVHARWCFARSAQAKVAGDIFVEKTNDPSGGITIAPQTDGFDWMFVSLNPADTGDVAPGTYYHEAEVIDGSGNIFTIAVGKFKLVAAVLPPRSTSV